MRNNYRTHLEYELSHLIDKERSARRVASKDEDTWKRAFSVAESFMNSPDEAADQAEATAKEDFRTSHDEVAQIRTARGEVEEELFRFGEEAESWSFHQ